MKLVCLSLLALTLLVLTVNTRTPPTDSTYRRFWWKGAYTVIHAMNALQRYVGTYDQHIQNGYQLFMTYRLGYHIQLFRNRFFIEP